MHLLSTERSEDRAQLLNIITANRLALLQRAIKKQNYQVACHILDSLGRAAGELDPSTNDALAVPQISIRIEE